jgi:hypothetical protein
VQHAWGDKKCAQNFGWKLEGKRPLMFSTVAELRMEIQDDLKRHKTRLLLYFQHNGAPPRFGRHVMEYLSEEFHD